MVNRKGQFDGVSVTTFAFGTEELYGWLDGNAPTWRSCRSSVVNDPDAIGRNAKAVTVNGALAIDIHGPGRGGHHRRRAVLGHRRPRGLRVGAGAVGRGPLAALPAARPSRSTASSARRIAPWFDAGAVITTPRHQVDVVITEYGAAELQGKTVHQRGDGARRDRPPGLPRRPPRGGRARLARAVAGRLSRVRGRSPRGRGSRARRRRGRGALCSAGRGTARSRPRRRRP